MTRQDNKVGMKTLIVLTNESPPQSTMEYAITQYKELFDFQDDEILYLNEAEASQLNSRILRGNEKTL
jgi:hypothetical protein